MANTREIRRRIKSIKNTAQITKAMQLVAASKMRRAQQVAIAGRNYSDLFNRVLVSLRERVDASEHPMLEERPVRRELVLIISTDKGLCGALNTNLLRETNRFTNETARYVASGRKSVQYLARTGRDLLADFDLKDSPSFAETKRISKFCVEQFLNGEVDRVSVIYTQFINTLNQRATVRTLLPISAFELDQPQQGGGDSSESGSPNGQGPAKVNTFGYLFEPSAPEVLDAILPQYVHYQVYQMVLNARASEHSARMVAMKNATDNAKQIVKDLTLEYNKVRQAAITTELLEISVAQMALGS